MEEPIQFFRKNTALGSPGPGILAWPLARNEENGEPFTGTLAQFGPYWVGDWQTPPPEVCDILTAAEWKIQFQFTPSELGEGDPGLSPVSLETTIKPGQIKRKTEVDGEYVIGGDGWQSVLDIIQANFEESEEYDEGLLTNEFFRLQYEWTSPVVDDGEELDGLFSVVSLTIRLRPPATIKNEDDEWVWFFGTNDGPTGLSSYSVVTVDTTAEDGFLTSLIASGNVINFMDNQHDDPVTGFPVVSLSIVSHFGDD
jgi:hypothetical protein